MMTVFFSVPFRQIAVLVFVLCLGSLSAQEALRGQVMVDLEQVRGFALEEDPLNPREARTRALEEAAYYFGGMIYGWSFRYEVGERARNIEEKLDLTPLGRVSVEDPRLEPGDVQIKNHILYLWADYRPAGTQRYRLAKWKAGSVRSAQGYGQSLLENKGAALEDAARAALRAMLRGSERNRPREVVGYISLAAFPRYWLEGGRWAAMGRFLVEIGEVRPFAAY
ncbi:MAG: hypothetical protein LBD31_09085 [Treponema sp.]|jgi:hypothetical protein|nr:hypothetical protein [Treponema sp.]